MSDGAIIWTTVYYSEDKTMSIITALFQAIGQALAWLLPISEWGHSSIFHDFSGRVTGACSTLTGVVHIGIAVGIIAALYKVFLTLAKQFFETFSDIFKKQLKTKPVSPSRKFMYMTLLSFVPMLLWLIPTGKNGLLFSLLHKTGYNATLLDDGIFFVLTGVLVLLSAKQLSLANNNKSVTVLSAVIVGIACVFLVPVSGLSLMAGVFAILLLFGVSKKPALRFALVMSVPVLLVMGIVELCIAVSASSVVSVIIGLIVSAAVSFFTVKAVMWLVNNNKIKYFGLYDLGIGAITAVIGIFELALK